MDALHAVGTRTRQVAPGRYRSTPIYVHDDRSDRNVYEGPEPEKVAELVRSLVRTLGDMSGEAMVQAAMAHLNLVMIHPFRHGSGRMARALQTLDR
ncbi:Fic family protein [Micropruina sp.]|uniref:Fic family protein n=1 Tax=Micropruina sp. TaxID=2737536 RepID=UPI0039E51286